MKKYKRFIVLGIILISFFTLNFWAKKEYVVPIVMYHNIDGNSDSSRLSVSPKSFRAQMAFLKRFHYNVVKLEALPELIEKGKIPPRTIAVTFDDGYENNYKEAYPVLKELSLPATIFISPALVGSEGFLTWSQVAAMSDSGVISIGSHTMTHAYLTDLPEQKLDIEIFDSKRAIESHIKKDVSSFSYPLGGFNKKVREKVKEAGYRIAAATNPGKKYPAHDIFAMKRLRISKTSDNLFVFWIETSGLYTWIKEHRDKD